MPLFAFSALIHGYVGWRVLPDLAWPTAGVCAFAAVLLATAILIPAGVMRWRRRAGPLSPALAWGALLSIGLFSSLFVLTVLRDGLLVLAAVAAAIGTSIGAVDLPVGALGAWTAGAVPLLGAFVTAVGFRNARRTAAVVSVDVPIRNLPEALHGFTIAQISDIHVGPTIRGGYLRSIVEAVNALNADLVAVTGDLVDGTVRELAEHVAPLRELASRHGTFFVTGNHEYYSGAPAWIRQLRGLGVRVLMNEHVVVRRGGASLVIAGVTDHGAHHFEPSHRSDPDAAIAGAPVDAAVRVLLAHQPRSAHAAAQAGFDVQLSGHTHGGQFLPWTLFVRLQQPFTAGLHRLQRMWVYTSRGTGYWGPPKRFGAPSEITRLRLVPER